MLFEFAAIILAMSVLGEQFIGIGDSKLSGENLAASITNMVGGTAAAGVVGVFAAKATMAPGELARALAAEEQADAAHEAAKTAFFNGTVSEQDYQAANRKCGTAAGLAAQAQGDLDVYEGVGSRLSIIGTAMILVAALEQTAGFGPPCSGDDFTIGADRAATVHDQLCSAFPDDSWRGSARQAYCGQNNNQLSGVWSMVELDRKLADIVQDQADAVTYVRLGFGFLMALLAAAYVYELRMALLFGPTSLVMEKSYAIAGAKVGIGVAVIMVLFLGGWSIYNGQKAGDVADGYRALEA